MWRRVDPCEPASSGSKSGLFFGFLLEQSWAPKFIENISNKIYIIYREVKKNEITPSTDYLFTGIQRSNLEKSIEKLDKLDIILQKKP